MTSSTEIDALTGRKFTLDEPEVLSGAEPLTILLNLHGGGSVGAWQRAYFPACDYVDEHRLAVATPSAATKEPFRMWLADADDEHLRQVVEQLFNRYGRDRIRALWLVGHSQGGMTSRRLLEQDWWRARVDGWLSLSGGRIGPVEIPDAFFEPFRRAGVELPRPRGSGLEAGPGRASPPDADLSFIYSCGEHEIVSLPDTSPWAERYGAGPRERRPDIIDDEAGKIHDTLREGRSNAAWGLLPRPGRAEVWVYPGAREGRVIADVIRIDKGHTEGLEPKVTQALIRMMVDAPGGKAANAA